MSAILNLSGKASAAKKAGVIALKGCMEHLNNSREELEELRDIAKAHGMDYGVKLGGPTAKHDAGIARSLAADFIVVPMIESVYAASRAADLGPLAGDVPVDMMIESKAALADVEIWKTIIISVSGCIIFGLTDIQESGGDLSQVARAYDLVDTFGERVAFGGGMTPLLAEKLIEEKPGLYAIETRHCRLKVADCADIGIAVARAIDFEAAFYASIGRHDVSEKLLSRINGGENGSND